MSDSDLKRIFREAQRPYFWAMMAVVTSFAFAAGGWAYKITRDLDDLQMAQEDYKRTSQVERTDWSLWRGIKDVKDSEHDTKLTFIERYLKISRQN